MDINKQLKYDIDLRKRSIESYYKTIKFNQQVLDEYTPLLDNPKQLLAHWLETGLPCKLKGIPLGPNFKPLIVLEIERQYALKYTEANQIVSIQGGLEIARKLSSVSLYLNGYEAMHFLTPIQDIKRALIVVPINFVEINKAIKTPQVKAILEIIKMIDSPTRNFKSIWKLMKEYSRKYDSHLANNWVAKHKIKKELNKSNGYLRLKQRLNDLVMRLGYYGKPSIDSRLGKIKQLRQEYLNQLNYLFNDILKLDIPIEIKFIANLSKR